MSGRRLVPGPFGLEKAEKGGRAAIAHPVVGIRAAYAVLRVLVGALGRPRRGRHSGHRTPTRIAAALGLLAGLVLLPMALQPAPAAGAKKVTFAVALTTDVDSLNPFLGVEGTSYEMWALTYDYL